jgi:hypothetical protein
MACLRRRLRETDHLLALLAAGGRDLVTSALDAVVGLDVPEVCGNSMALVERLPLPEDEATRAALTELEDRLAAANAEKLTGDYETALGRLTDLAPLARELSYPPTLAEVMILKGYVEAALGQAEDADRSLREAFGAAEQGRCGSPDTSRDGSRRPNAGAISRWPRSSASAATSLSRRSMPMVDRRC